MVEQELNRFLEYRIERLNTFYICYTVPFLTDAKGDTPYAALLNCQEKLLKTYNFTKEEKKVLLGSIL